MQGSTEIQTVLLTESNAMIRLDLCDALEKAGYRVAGPAATLAEAEALLEHRSPSLAVLGVGLSNSDGTAFARALRARGIPFLVHSEQPLEEVVISALGDAPWLAKPTHPEDLVIVLNGLSVARTKV